MILTAIREYLRPASLGEAWAALAERGRAAKPIGGGIDADRAMPPETTALVDLTGAGLTYVRVDEGVAIGATTTFTEILESSPARVYLDGILIEVLEGVASPLQRNLGTIGGTLGSAHPWSDVIPLLLVLDAALVVYDGRKRTVPLAHYLASRAGGDRPLIVELRLPEPSAASACAFQKHCSTGFDVAVLNCACFVSLERDRCATVRIAVGGTPALATRVDAAERELIGSRLNDSAIGRAARQAAETIDARDDRRATGAYRRELARIGVSRCLRQAADRLGDGQ